MSTLEMVLSSCTLPRTARSSKRPKRSDMKTITSSGERFACSGRAMDVSRTCRGTRAWTGGARDPHREGGVAAQVCLQHRHAGVPMGNLDRASSDHDACSRRGG